MGRHGSSEAGRWGRAVARIRTVGSPLGALGTVEGDPVVGAAAGALAGAAGGLPASGSAGGAGGAGLDVRGAGGAGLDVRDAGREPAAAGAAAASDEGVADVLLTRPAQAVDGLAGQAT